MTTPARFNAAQTARKARPFQGRLLKGFAKSLPPDELARIRRIIADGFAEGVTTQEIVRRIQKRA